jgi:uncharacterized protein (DUF1501 family)
MYQGTYVDSQHTSVDKLIENIRNPRVSAAAQSRQLELLRTLNAEHHAPRGFDPQLDARIQSFELAYRMQMEAADAFDISKEPEAIRQAYGEHVQGRQTLIARRLIERGVRFVEVTMVGGAGNVWDQHNKLKENHAKNAFSVDQPIAGLIQDLKARGLFDQTLIIWSGEFGRAPFVQGSDGRDHNPYGFSLWLAGGGVKGGTVFGATDEYGYRTVEDALTVYDLHATVLHLLGLDHERLRFRYGGRDFRLTDVHGSVIRKILA